MARTKEKTAVDLAREDILAAMNDAQLDHNAAILEGIRETLPGALAVLGVSGLHRALRMRSGFTASRRALVDWLDANGIREKKAVPPELLKARAAGRVKAKEAGKPEAVKADAPEPEQAKGETWDETVPEAVPEVAAPPEEFWQPVTPPEKRHEGKIMTTGGYVSPEEVDKEREAIRATACK